MGKPFLGTDEKDHLVGSDFHAIAVVEPLSSLLQEDWVSCIGFIVAVRLWIFGFLVETVDDRSWRWLIGIADSEVDEVFAFSACCCLEAGNFSKEVGWNQVEALGTDWHGDISFRCEPPLSGGTGLVQLDRAGIDKGCWTGHKDVVACFIPEDLQVPSSEGDVD